MYHPLLRGVPAWMWSRPLPPATPRTATALGLALLWAFLTTVVVAIVAAPPPAANWSRVLLFATIVVACALSSAIGFEVVMRGDEPARRAAAWVILAGGVACALGSFLATEDAVVQALCIAIACLTPPLVLLLARPFARRRRSA